MPYAVNTELGSGLVEARGFTKLEPQEVAEAIVEGVPAPRGRDLGAASQQGHVQKVTALLPRKVSEGISRALKADQVLAGADANARRGYELRAAHSEPGLEPGDERKLLAEAADAGGSGERAQ